MESRSHSSSECSDDLQELDIESGATSTSLPETTTSSEASTSTASSLLDRLRSPQPSDLARKRHVKSNPPRGSWKGKGKVTADPKSVSPSDRVKAYPGENFIVSNKKLFCRGCREELALKKSIVENHIASFKHKRGKDRLESKTKYEREISEALKRYDREHHPVGEHLPDSTRVYRVRVVSTMLKAGVPLSKLDKLRDLLEENARALTTSSSLRQLLPFILQNEISLLKKEIDGKYLSILFDGTTHICEALVMIIRYMDDDWQTQQRICRLMLLSKSITGEELARQIITAISTELGISSHLVVAAMHDRAAVNTVAMRTVSILYDKMMSIGCFSHTLDHVGEKMKVPVLEELTKSWISMFAHSPKTRVLWRSLTGLAPPSFSVTRWWSRFEVMHQLFKSFGDLIPFLQNPELTSTACTKMLAILNNPPQLRKLQMELAIMVDAMEPFVKATYILEGDGALALTTYGQIDALYQSIALQHYPNVVAKTLSNGISVHEQQLIGYAKECVKPAYEYFQQKFNDDLQSVLKAFKAAQLFSPSRVCELRPSTTDIDQLSSFPFIDDATMDSLKSELPYYMATANGVATTMCAKEWWKGHHHELPHWASVYRKIALVQPSSAACERVFSLLANSFASQQERALEDYIQLSVMLQYNQR